MEKKKSKLWIIILISVLILGIGGSFAYFVTRVLSNGNGAEVNVKTASKGNTTVKVEGIMESDVSGKYPGHKSISAIKVTATGEDNVSFNLSWIGTSTISTPINYTVYKTTNAVDANVSCEAKRKESVDLSIYYYEECSEEVSNLGEKKESNKIDAYATDKKYKLITNEEIQATKEGAEVYYYIILEIPNKKENQNRDMNGSIHGELNIELIAEYDKCKGPACETILANNEIKTEKPDFNYSSNGYSEYLYQDNYTSIYSFEVDDFPAINEDMKLYTMLDSDGNDMYTDYTGTFFDESIETAFLGDGTWDSENNKCTYTDADGNINDVYSFITWDAIQDERECNKVYFESNFGGLGYVSFNEYKYLGLAKDILTHEYAPVTEGLYRDEDDDGYTYYFRGNISKNYVNFAGFYWRIVRINGDGTIRLIYDGDSAFENGATSANRQIGSSKFNSYAYDNAYVGYMYGQTGRTTYEETHTNKNTSTIKTVVDDWYKINILDKGYDRFIDQNAGFCGDRSLFEGTGIANQTTKYKVYERLQTGTIAPSFKCFNKENDLYSIPNSIKGNKALAYPIGLITADELAYSGLSGKGYKNSFLKASNSYWTMTPYTNSSISVGEPYYMSSSYLTNTNAVRPVINLNANVNFAGSGTMEDPYTVS